MPQEDDDRLVARALSGDTAAFEAIVNRYRKPIYNLAYRMLGTHDRADDAAQEAFVRAYTRLKTYRPGGRFSAWMFAIASNLCIDSLRRTPFAADSLNDADGEQATIANGAPGPAATYQRREMQTRVHHALGRLPDAQRLALALVHLRGLSYQEAAEAMGQPVNTVKSHVHRARTRLKTLLTPYMEEAVA